MNHRLHTQPHESLRDMRGGRWVEHGLLLFALLALSGCPAEVTPDLSDTSAINPTPDATVQWFPDSFDPDIYSEPKSCDDGTVRFLRIAPWPDGGLQIVALLRDENGKPVADLEEIQVAFENGGSYHPVALSPAPQSHGLTAIAFLPSTDETIHQRRVDAAHALIEGLSPGERAALWRAGETPVLLADFTDQREHILERLHAVQSSEAEETLGSLEPIREALMVLESPWGSISRELVVVTKQRPFQPFAPNGESPVTTRWITDQGAPTDLRNNAASWEEDGDPVAAASRLLEQINNDRQTIFRVGTCPGLTAQTPVAIHVGTKRCSILAPNATEDLSEVHCSAPEAASDAFPFGDTIEILLTEEEKTLYDENHAAQSKDKMSAHLRLGPSDPIEATIHFRGSTSLKCERKSFDINLKGDKSRRIMPERGSDRFLLVSMCKDYGYFHQLLANTLLAEFGLFPLEFRLVRVRINGKNEGMYLQLDLPSSSLIQDHTAIQTVIRRRLDFEDEPEDIKFPEALEEQTDALTQYAVLAEFVVSTDPAGLVEILAKHMDIDGYLRWMAFNTFLRCGDYVDEVFFYASEEAGGKWYFRMHGWDADDLFSACHLGGIHALYDPNGILYCAEGDLDEGLLLSTVLYNRFVEILKQLITEKLTDAHLQTTMNSIRDKMWTILSDDETAQAMKALAEVHPEAHDMAGVKTAIETLMANRLQQASTRRTELLEKIDAYQAAQQR